MTYDVIVIGAGIHGLASTHHLAKSGRRVLLLEQFEVGHVRGSSHGETRIIRYAYEQPEYVRLADRAFAAWRELERESGTSLLEVREHLDLAEPQHPAFRAVLGSLRSCAAPHEVLEPAALERRFPMLNATEGYHAILDQRAGLLRANTCVQTLHRLAMNHGVTLRQGVRVEDIRATPDRVRVRLENEWLEAGQLVISAGAWVNTILEFLGLRLPLEVYLTQSAFCTPSVDLERFPIFYDHHTSVYGIPESGTGVLKVGNRHREPVHPDRRDFAAIQPNLESLAAWVAAHLNGVSSDFVSALTCLYTFTPDEDFVIDTLPHLENIAVISACSGHGFKFAPVIGELVVGLLEGRTAPERFRATRFGTLEVAS